MSKIFRYEFCRMVFSRFYLGLTAVTLWYGWQILSTVTILGTAHTAPFSPWSFGSYLSQTLPILNIILLFLLWNQFSPKARQTEVLTSMTPADPSLYRLIKCGAVAAAWLLLALLLTAMGMGFLAVLFGTDVQADSYVLVSVMTLLPPFMLFLGLGLLAGRTHAFLLFALMALGILVGCVRFPMAADLCSRSFFSEYPLMFAEPEPVFSVPVSVLAGKGVFLLTGAAALRYSMRCNREHSEETH